MPDGRGLTAAIIGCGMIAGGYDADQSNEAVSTHAGALVKLGIRIVACVEPDEARRVEFMARWDVEQGFADLGSLLSGGEPMDLVSVCSPTERHEADLLELAAAPVRAVFAEKPLADDIGAARRLVAIYHAAGRPLAVNYTRRWNPALRDLATAIAAGAYGAVTGLTGWYGKGVVHNGTHMIDLLRLLVGDLRPARGERLVRDGREADPTIDALLLADGDVPIRLIGTDYRDYDLFELQIRATEAVLSIDEGGTKLRIRPVESDRRHSGHRRPVDGTLRDIAPRDAMVRAVDNILGHLAHGEPLASDGRSALAAQEVATALADMARNPR